MQPPLPAFSLLLACSALAVCAALVSCAPLAAPPAPLATVTPIPSETPTATIVWFPLTATPTPLPTVTHGITPTLDLRPRFGALLLADDFSQPELWSLGRMHAGTMALGINELTLAVSQARGYLFSLRSGPDLGDFYLEINASPSICRGEDAYGLLLRVTASLEFFRFGLSCNGYARLDRVYQEQASSPQPPLMNGAIPPGAPSSSRLGVWARGREMRFYANGEYLFSVRDPTLSSGSLGVFVRAAGPDMVTVNFSDLVVYEVLE
jgi:hypothetical protein